MARQRVGVTPILLFGLQRPRCFQLCVPPARGARFPVARVHTCYASLRTSQKQLLPILATLLIESNDLECIEVHSCSWKW